MTYLYLTPTQRFALSQILSEMPAKHLTWDAVVGQIERGELIVWAPFAGYPASDVVTIIANMEAQLRKFVDEQIPKAADPDPDAYRIRLHVKTQMIKSDVVASIQDAYEQGDIDGVFTVNDPFVRCDGFDIEFVRSKASDAPHIERIMADEQMIWESAALHQLWKEFDQVRNNEIVQRICAILACETDCDVRL